MNFSVTESFEKKVGKLLKKNPKLKLELIKQLSLFRDNPLHPSLKLHKLKGKRSTQYAVWILSDLRALCIKNGEMFIFFDVVTHDEY